MDIYLNVGRIEFPILGSVLWIAHESRLLVTPRHRSYADIVRDLQSLLLQHAPAGEERSASRSIQQFEQVMVYHD